MLPVANSSISYIGKENPVLILLPGPLQPLNGSGTHFLGPAYVIGPNSDDEYIRQRKGR